MPFSRYLAAVALLLSDLVIFFAFPLYAHYGYLEMILLMVGCLLFALIPSKWLEKVKEQLSAFREKQLVRQTINRNRSMLSNRLYEISTVFLEMGNIFNSFQRHVMSEEKARAHISERIDAEICRSCENYKRCRQKRAPSPAALEKLAEIGIAKGRVSFIDLPKEISEQCIHANNLIFFLNKQLAEYRSYILESMNMDVGRQMIGAQAIGISEILKGLAVETAQTLKMQSKLEKALSAALAQKGFFPSELLVYGEGEHTEVSMILPNREFALKPFCDAVGEAVGTDMTVSEKANVTEDKIFVTLRHAPRYDAVFGIAHAAKDGSSASGDTHSVLRIGPNRFLVALSDGMGSGEYAESVSGATLALIELYRTGHRRRGSHLPAGGLHQIRRPIRLYHHGRRHPHRGGKFPPAGHSRGLKAGDPFHRPRAQQHARLLLGRHFGRLPLFLRDDRFSAHAAREKSAEPRGRNPLSRDCAGKRRKKRRYDRPLCAGIRAPLKAKKQRAGFLKRQYFGVFPAQELQTKKRKKRKIFLRPADSGNLPKAPMRRGNE